MAGTTRYHIKKVDGVPASDAPKRSAKVRNLIRTVIDEGEPGATYLIATYGTVRGAEEAKYRQKQEFDHEVDFSSVRRADGTSRLYITLLTAADRAG